MDKLTQAKVDFYEFRIKHNKMTIDEVPEKYRQYLITDKEPEDTSDDITLDDWSL